jgi:ADP-ribose pyrophosphatase YjhB (NUDIX family)
LTRLLAVAEELRAMAANGLYYPCSDPDTRLLTALRHAAADLYAALGAGPVGAVLAADSLRTPLGAVAVFRPDGGVLRDWMRPEESVPDAAVRLAGTPCEVATVLDDADRPDRVTPHTVIFVLRAPGADLPDDDRKIADLLPKAFGPERGPGENRVRVDGGVSDLTELAARLRRIALAGLAGSTDPYNLDRYRRARSLAATLAALRATPGPPPEGLGIRTPTLGAEGAIFDDEDRLLLVRRAGDGTWALPGGIGEVGESLADTVVREIREELGGLVVAPTHLIAVHDNRLIGAPTAHVPIVATYACRIVSGTPGLSAEVLDFGWFAPNGVRTLAIFHAHPAKIAAAFADRVRLAGRSLGKTSGL